jgi:hypothetical protein
LKLQSNATESINLNAFNIATTMQRHAKATPV